MNLESWIAREGLSALGESWRPLFADARLEPSYLTDPRTREIVFRLPPGEGRARAKALAALLRLWAAEVVPQEVAQMGSTLRLLDRYKRVSVRDQSGRWGSCSSSGTLSFNWRLVLLPWPLHQYVILHEFGHFAHMDHSGDFWDFLHRHDPDAGRHDRALMKASRAIMALGRH